MAKKDKWNYLYFWPRTERVEREPVPSERTARKAALEQDIDFGLEFQDSSREKTSEIPKGFQRRYSLPYFPH